MKSLGTITLFDNAQAHFFAIGEGLFETIHLVIANGDKVLHLENFIGLKSVLSNMNAEVSRQALTPEVARQEIDEVFVFNPPLSSNHATSCQRIQNACRELALAIADEVPEGKEQTIAVNNLLAAALWSRHGITRRQVVVGAVPLEISTSPEPSPAGSPPPEATSPAPPSAAT